MPERNVVPSVAELYEHVDEIFRLNMGDTADCTCAYYNGDYSLTLEQAQAAKHRYILKQINFKPGMRVLDIGCGWGPMLKAIKEAGGEGVGLTLSPKQVAICRKYNMAVHFKDWKDMQPDEYDSFDGVVSVGSFEHFASKEDYLQGRQDEVYKRFFQLNYDILPPHGRLFLQTMVFGKNMPLLERVSSDSPKGSDEYLMHLLEKMWLDSWLPYGQEAVTRNAEGFKLVASSNGRKDYLQTIAEWANHDNGWNLQRIWAKAKLIPMFCTSQHFRDELKALQAHAQPEAFRREIFDHWRLTFEKV